MMLIQCRRCGQWKQGAPIDALNSKLRDYLVKQGRDIESLRLWCKGCIEAGAKFAKIPVEAMWEQ